MEGWKDGRSRTCLTLNRERLIPCLSYLSYLSCLSYLSVIHITLPELQKSFYKDKLFFFYYFIYIILILNIYVYMYIANYS